INVPNLNGMASNASVEAIQSLLRLGETDLASRSNGWMPCLFLWLNDGESAMNLAWAIMRGFATNEWGQIAPSTDEEAVDAWLAASQVCLINAHPTTVTAVFGTFDIALDRAKRSGDVVRTARVIALFLLAMAETKEDVPGLARKYESEFND